LHGKTRVVFQKSLPDAPYLPNYAPLYGAIGTAMNCREPWNMDGISLGSVEDLVISPKQEKKYYNPPLKLELSDYPDFESHDI